jgi:hypothetical protein
MRIQSETHSRGRGWLRRADDVGRFLNINLIFIAGVEHVLRFGYDLVEALRVPLLHNMNSPPRIAASTTHPSLRVQYTDSLYRNTADRTGRGIRCSGTDGHRKE